MHKNEFLDSQVQITPVVYPSTTVVAVSSGPGPPQVKQTSTTLMCKKLPSEQIAINHQSTAKTVINFIHLIFVFLKSNVLTFYHRKKLRKHTKNILLMIYNLLFF